MHCERNDGNSSPDIQHGLPQAYTCVALAARSPTAEQPAGVVFIEVTNRCNLRCRTCVRTFTALEKPQTLRWERFLHLASQFPGLQRAVLHGIGEPLLNPELPRMIAYLKERGATVLFNTNATLLSEEWGRALIASGLNELRCSLDAARPASYARIRGAPLLPQIVQNLRSLTALQRRLNAARPRLSLWMTATLDNIAELPELVQLAAELQVPEVYLQRLVTYLDGDSAAGMPDSRRQLFGNGSDEVDAIIARAEALGRATGVSLSASGAAGLRRGLEAVRSEDHRPWADCRRLWTSAYVTANGNCLPCCMSPFATTDYASLVLGNLFEQDFRDIWNAGPYQTWRRRLLSPTPPPPCQGCGVHWSL